MSYGRFSSYRKVREAVSTGVCDLAVNRFRPVQLMREVASRRVLIRLAYWQKCVIPALVCAVLSLLVFQTAYAWVAVVLTVLLSYFFDISIGFAVLGGLMLAFGVNLGNQPVALVGACLPVSYACAMLWWKAAESIIRKESMADKARFDAYWNQDLVALMMDGKVMTSEGVRKSHDSRTEMKRLLARRRRQMM